MLKDLMEQARERTSLPAALVDVDGTLALRGERGPHDLDRVSEDKPNMPVVETVQALHLQGFEIVFISGRQCTEQCRWDTYYWLFDHVQIDAPLLMRSAGDFRQDAVVKKGMYDAHVRGRFDVRLVLDDRQQCVDMWRAEGLTCFQVAPGDF